VLNIALEPHQLRKILSAAKEEDLREELAKREQAQKTGRCDYCNEPLESEPYCPLPHRHEGRPPADWEGLCDTPRVTKDRWTLQYWRDDGTHVTMSRFPGSGWHRFSHRVHIACDGDGCDHPFCEGGFVRQHVDFGDDLKVKWPEDVIDFGSGGPSKRSGPGFPKKEHA
jgi:hypothetical protein